MFPSWDEPAFRATYRLSVTVPKDFATEMGSKLSEFFRPFVVAEVAPLFWSSAPKDQLDGYIDATPGLPPQVAAKAKHQIDIRLAQRAALLPAIDATVASKPAGR